MKWPAFLLAAVVLGSFFFAAGFGALLEPLLYTMTPFERYYAGAYLRSTWNGIDPSATTEARLLWKARPLPNPLPRSRKTEPKFETGFATEGDVDLRPLGERIGKYSPEPFALSDGARAEGWTAVYRGQPQTIKSAELENLLREEVYGGEPLWRFLVQPAAGAAGLMVVALAFLLWRRRLRQRYPWRTDGEAMWFAVRSWSVASAGRLAGELSRGLEWRPARVLEGGRPEPRRELPAPVPQPFSASAASATEPQPRPPQASQPVTVSPAVPVRRAYVWDESEGID